MLFLFSYHIAKETKVFDTFETKQANVLIVNEEDSLRLIQDRYKTLNILDKDLPIYFRVARGAKLTEDFVKEIIDECKQKNITVVMFDSLRALNDANENDSQEMQKVMDMFKMLSRENITVVFTHHHRKKPTFGGKQDDTESSRGSTSINAAVSGHISLEEESRDDGLYLIVKHIKSKSGEKLEPFEVFVGGAMTIPPLALMSIPEDGEKIPAALRSVSPSYLKKY